MLKQAGQDVEGKTALVSGAGNVATYAIQKINQLGGKVVTFSDSSGFVYDEHGVDDERLEFLIDLKTKRRGRVEEYAKEFGAEFHADGKPWKVKADLALPCATQNEISQAEARIMIDNGIQAVAEGANMPTEQNGIHDFVDARVLFAPSKAANAGGVAISGLEMSQNSARITWKEEELQRLLKDIMSDIHGRCVEYGSGDDGYVDYVKGANIAGFIKVADALVAYGVV
jgi:glutamate dehydrogenase (NADP+)